MVLRYILCPNSSKKYCCFVYEYIFRSVSVNNVLSQNIQKLFHPEIHTFMENFLLDGFEFPLAACPKAKSKL